MDICEIVKKLVGKIEPIGDESYDKKSFENLKVMTDLIDKLLFDITEVVAENKNRQEYSMKRAGEYANKFLDEIGIEYNPGD